MRKAQAAKRIKELMAEGKSASDVIKEHPELTNGLDELIKGGATRERRSRGSGPTLSGPALAGDAVAEAPFELPVF